MCLSKSQIQNHNLPQLLTISNHIKRQNCHFKMRTFPQAFVKEDRELTVLRTLVSNLDPSRSSKGK